MDFNHFVSAVTVTLALVGCLWKFAQLCQKLEMSMEAMKEDVAELKVLGLRRDTIPTLEGRIARLEAANHDAAIRLV